MKIKLFLVPAFILGSVLFVNAQNTPQTQVEATKAQVFYPDTDKGTKVNSGGGSENIQTQKPETTISTKQVNNANANSDKDKNKNTGISKDKTGIKSTK